MTRDKEADNSLLSSLAVPSTCLQVRFAGSNDGVPVKGASVFFSSFRAFICWLELILVYSFEGILIKDRFITLNSSNELKRAEC